MPDGSSRQVSAPTPPSVAPNASQRGWIFFSADESYVRSLAQRGILDRASIRVYAEGRLVLVTLRGSGIRLGSLGELLRPEVLRRRDARTCLLPSRRTTDR